MDDASEIRLDDSNLDVSQQHMVLLQLSVRMQHGLPVSAGADTAGGDRAGKLQISQTEGGVMAGSYVRRIRTGFLPDVLPDLIMVISRIPVDNKYFEERRRKR